MDLKDKVVIVTGASYGIGLATSKLLANKGAKVVLAARSEPILKDLQERLADSFAFTTDMRVHIDIANLIDETMSKYGRVDILVNNAGQGMYGLVEDINVEDLKSIMELNVYGPLRAMELVIPIMREQGGGIIINVSSGVSKAYYPYIGAYAATKYALNAISLTARTELWKEKIVISVMHPKITETYFSKNAIGERPDFFDKEDIQMDTPEQVAEGILQLIESGNAELEM